MKAYTMRIVTLALRGRAAVKFKPRTLYSPKKETLTQFLWGGGLDKLRSR